MNGKIDVSILLNRIKDWCDHSVMDECCTILYKYEFEAILNYIEDLNKQLEEVKDAIVYKANQCLRIDKELSEKVRKEKQAYINMYNMYVEEKKKNEKAIEYIENARKLYTQYEPMIFMNEMEIESLYQILKGENNEQTK